MVKLWASVCIHFCFLWFDVACKRDHVSMEVTIAAESQSCGVVNDTTFDKEPNQQAVSDRSNAGEVEAQRPPPPMEQQGKHPGMPSGHWSELVALAAGDKVQFPTGKWAIKNSQPGEFPLVFEIQESAPDDEPEEAERIFAGFASGARNFDFAGLAREATENIDNSGRGIKTYSWLEDSPATGLPDFAILLKLPKDTALKKVDVNGALLWLKLSEEDVYPVEWLVKPLH